MAELLIRAVDKTNPDDVYLNVKLTKRFDVICICPDGWPWSVEERTNPAWRLISLPNVSPAELELLLRPATGDPLVNRTLQRRGWKCNMGKNNVPAQLRNWFNDASRSTPMRTFAVDAAWLIANVVEQKPAVPDPAVIG